MSIREALKAARRFIGPLVEDVSYGFARPDNPHDFSPDRESCTPEEIAAHKAACEAYDRGEYDPRADPTSINAGPLHILRAPWGIGSSTWRDPEAAAALAKIDAALRELDAVKPVAWAGGIGPGYRVVWGDAPPDEEFTIALYAAPPLRGEEEELVRKALRRAYSLGQTYWQQADSESYSQNRKAAETEAKFRAHCDETIAALLRGER